MTTNRITVLWYANDSKLGWIIQKVTRSDFTHVAAMVNGTLYEALGSGIIALGTQNASRRMKMAVAYKDIDVAETDSQQADFWLSSRVSNRYSIAGFIAAGLGTLTRWKIVVALDGTYICSGLVAKALEIAGVPIAGEARLQTPESLARLLQPEYINNLSRKKTHTGHPA